MVRGLFKTEDPGGAPQDRRMCSSKCVAMYSSTGVLFLLFVLTLLNTQPFFVIGVDNVESAKRSAGGAAIMFAVLFLLSLASMRWSNLRRNVAEEHGGYRLLRYDDYQDGGSGSSRDRSSYQLSDQQLFL